MAKTAILVRALPPEAALPLLSTYKMPSLIHTLQGPVPCEGTDCNRVRVPSGFLRKVANELLPTSTAQSRACSIQTPFWLSADGDPLPPVGKGEPLTNWRDPFFEIFIATTPFALFRLVIVYR